MKIERKFLKFNKEQGCVQKMIHGVTFNTYMYIDIVFS